MVEQPRNTTGMAPKPPPRELTAKNERTATGKKPEQPPEVVNETSAIVASRSDAEPRQRREQPETPRENEPPTGGAPSSLDRPPDWLRLDEHGEPCQVTLADGTVLKLDTYENEYQAYDYRPPITLFNPQLRQLIDFKQVHGHGDSVSHLQFDSKSQMMYWSSCVPPHRVGRIVRASLEGESLVDLVTGLENVPGFAIDPVRKKMYWTDLQTRPSIHAVKSANFDGSNIQDLLPGAKGWGIAAEPESGDIFYWEDAGVSRRHINRVKSDGSGDKQIVAQEFAPGCRQIIVERVSRKLYWSGHGIRRSNLDGSDPEFVIEPEGDGGFAVDSRDQKVYWAFVGEVCRSNLDGTQVETILIAPPESENTGKRYISGVAIEPERRWLYVSGYYFDGPSAIGTLSRMDIPPLLKPVTKQAPPRIAGFSPPQQAPGGEVVLQGAGFTGVTKVALFDDGNGHEVSTRFKVRSDAELTFTMPKLSDACRYAAAIVLGPGGVTVMLPHAPSVSHPNVWVPLPGKLYVSTVNKTGVYSNVWYVKGEPKRYFNAISTSLIQNGGEGVRSLIFAENGSILSTKERGNNIVFMKNGARTQMSRWRTVIYHEPFALIHNSILQSATETSTTLIAVPAIRPSFVALLLAYAQP